MAIDITNQDLINRQLRMKDCGVSPKQVQMLMQASDEAISKGITDALNAIQSMSGHKLEIAKGMLQALQIEAAIREESK